VDHVADSAIYHRKFLTRQRCRSKDGLLLQLVDAMNGSEKESSSFIVLRNLYLCMYFVETNADSYAVFTEHPMIQASSGPAVQYQVL